MEAATINMDLSLRRRILARAGAPVNDPLRGGRKRPKIRERLHSEIRCSAVPYKVHLSYFRQTGKFLATAETMIQCGTIIEIWAAINDMRRLGCLPSLRPGTGRDLFIVVDVPDHPQRVLHMVTPPFLDEDDVTPSRTMTGEPALLVRMPLNKVPRTTTRDIMQPVNELNAGVDVSHETTADAAPRTLSRSGA